MTNPTTAKTFRPGRYILTRQVDGVTKRQLIEVVQVEGSDNLWWRFNGETQAYPFHVHEGEEYLRVIEQFEAAQDPNESVFNFSDEDLAAVMEPVPEIVIDTETTGYGAPMTLGHKSILGTPQQQAVAIGGVAVPGTDDYLLPDTERKLDPQVFADSVLPKPCTANCEPTAEFLAAVTEGNTEALARQPAGPLTWREIVALTTYAAQQRTRHNDLIQVGVAAFNAFRRIHNEVQCELRVPQDRTDLLATMDKLGRFINDDEEPSTCTGEHDAESG